MPASPIRHTHQLAVRGLSTRAFYYRVILLLLLHRRLWNCDPFPYPNMYLCKVRALEIFDIFGTNVPFNVNDSYCVAILRLGVIFSISYTRIYIRAQGFLCRLRENLFRHQTIVLTQINFYPKRYELTE